MSDAFEGAPARAAARSNCDQVGIEVASNPVDCFCLGPRTVEHARGNSKALIAQPVGDAPQLRFSHAYRWMQRLQRAGARNRRITRMDSSSRIDDAYQRDLSINGK